MQPRTFKLIALVEAISYLALLVAVVFKHVYDQPGGVTVIGPFHGLVFFAYFMGVLFVREDQGWGLLKVVAVLGAALIPFGAFWAERQVVTPETTAAPDGR